MVNRGGAFCVIKKAGNLKIDLVFSSCEFGIFYKQIYMYMYCVCTQALDNEDIIYVY